MRFKSIAATLAVASLARRLELRMVREGGGLNAGFLRFRSNFARAGLWKSPNSIRDFLPLWNK